MITLTKLNQKSITVNALYIERVESTPDTVLTLITGRKILVLENEKEVRDKVTHYYKNINLLQGIKEVFPAELKGEGGGDE